MKTSNGVILIDDSDDNENTESNSIRPIPATIDSNVSLSSRTKSLNPEHRTLLSNGGNTTETPYSKDAPKVRSSNIDVISSQEHIFSGEHLAQSLWTFSNPVSCPPGTDPHSQYVPHAKSIDGTDSGPSLQSKQKNIDRGHSSVQESVGAHRPNFRLSMPCTHPHPSLVINIDDSDLEPDGNIKIASNRHTRQQLNDGSYLLISSKGRLVTNEEIENFGNILGTDISVNRKGQKKSVSGRTSEGGNEVVDLEPDLHTTELSAGLTVRDLDYNENNDVLTEPSVKEVIDLDEGDQTLSRTAWKSQNEVIDLDDYDRLLCRRAPRAGDMIIDLDEEEGVLYQDLLNQGSFAQAKKKKSGRPSIKISPRNLPINLPLICCERLEYDKLSFRPGVVVESKEGDFLLIKTLVQNLEIHYKSFLRGYRLQRTRDLNGILPKKLNELCWTLEVDLDDSRPFSEQSMVDLPLTQVAKLRSVNFTSQAFPAWSFRDRSVGSYCRNNVEEADNGVLAVRWKYTCVFDTARARYDNQVNERSVEHFRQSDLADLGIKGHEQSDADRCYQFRGDTVLGGSFPLDLSPNSGSVRERRVGQREEKNSVIIGNSVKPHMVGVNTDTLRPKRNRSVADILIISGVEIPRRIDRGTIVIDDEDEADVIFIDEPVASSTNSIAESSATTQVGQKYSYGDAFCGAGGATRGAYMSGLEPYWGFDFDEHACSTWNMNFPDGKIHQMWADEFISLGQNNNRFKVDILHLSPPCKFFSPAHTVDGKDDDMNSATLFACGLLLNVSKPRIVTLEQTFGLCTPRFIGFFNSLIQLFTEKGFSVRWKLCLLQDWGLPQRRLRLIVIGSCPGEVLPKFPPVTHSMGGVGGLKPWVSVNNVIQRVDDRAGDHDVRAVARKGGPPWNGDSIAPKCITTNGGQNYHPSGQRGFTNREYAALQGFPKEHIFGSYSVLKQIGNAVPPCVAKVLFTAVKRALEKADGVEPEAIVLD